MARMDYTGGVAKLLTIDVPQLKGGIDQWIDYQQDYGLNQTDIPELIRLATDKELSFEETEEEYPIAAMWGPMHARRALAQLKAAQAIEPLVKTLEWDEDDYSLEDFPKVFGLFGPEAIPALTRALQESNGSFSARTTTLIESLQQLAKIYPETLDTVGQALIEQLRLFNKNEPDLNGFLVNSLTNLKVEHALPLIEEVFKADKVDASIIRWHSVQYEFGLIDKAEHDRLEEEFRAALRASRKSESLLSSDAPFSGSNLNPPAKKQKEKAKAKRKIAKASQKKNRKRK
jgi:hypothetical protein